MNRRRLFRIPIRPALAALGIGAHAAAGRSRNPYYQGPSSDHFDGVRFFTPGQRTDRGLFEFLRWQLGGGRKEWPARYPSPFRDRPPQRVAGLRATLIGHASVLIQAAGANILVDPVFCERASPVSFAGPKRANPPGIAFDDLPPVDAVLVTHNHYDHLDLDAIVRLWRRFRPRIVAPLGNDAVIRGADPDIPVEARDWGETVALSDRVSVHVAPACHWSARGIGDRRMALWCAFVLATPRGILYHVGDTGYGDGRIFREVRRLFGPPRLALLPIGAYEPRWFMKPQHMNPDEAVRAMLDCGADTAIGHHWGTFRLTNEGVEDPIEQLAAARAAQGVARERFRALRPGEVWQPEAH